MGEKGKDEKKEKDDCGFHVYIGLLGIIIIIRENNRQENERMSVLENILYKRRRDKMKV